MKHYLLLYFNDSRKKDHSYCSAITTQINWIFKTTYTTEEILSMWDQLLEVGLVQVLADVDSGKVYPDGFAQSPFVCEQLEKTARELTYRCGLVKSGTEIVELTKRLILRGLFRKDIPAYRLTVAQRRWLLAFLRELTIIFRGLEMKMNIEDVMRVLESRAMTAL